MSKRPAAGENDMGVNLNFLSVARPTILCLVEQLSGCATICLGYKTDATRARMCNFAQAAIAAIVKETIADHCLPSLLKAWPADTQADIILI